MKMINLANNRYYIEFESEEELLNFKSYINTKKLNDSMKAGDVMKVLNITRQTLCHYVKNGLIKIDTNYTGKQYRYNKESVYGILRSKNAV